MGNSTIPTSPAAPGGRPLNAEVLPGAGPAGEDIYNERLQVVGRLLAQVAEVLNDDPAGSDYGLVVRNLPAGTSVAPTVVAVASSDVGPVTLLAANAARRGASFFNYSDRDLFLKEGAGGSAASFTVILVPGALYELPSPVWKGIVTGVWDAGPVGDLLVTERT